MDRTRLPFKKAVKKQLLLCLTSVAVLIFIIFEMHPIDSWEKGILLMGIIIFMGFGTLGFVRRSSNLVSCGSCKSNLYELMSQLGGPEHMEINYCPVCGEKIET